MSKKAS